MENQQLIHKIRAKYVYKFIFKFVLDQDFEIKLFSYSKYFQNKLKIDFSYCYKKYLDSLDFDFHKYLNQEEIFFEKDMLIKKYDNFISKNKLNKERFDNIIYKLTDKQNENNEKEYISLDSPLFEIISKTKYFNKNYTIFCFGDYFK